MNIFEVQRAAAQALFEPELRRRIQLDPKQYAIDNGLMAADSAAEVKVVTCSRDTMYLPMVRAEQTEALDAGQLEAIQAAGHVSTAGSAGTVGSLSTATTTAGTILTAGTAGTAGSVDT